MAEAKSLRIFPGLTRITDPAIIALISDKKMGHGWDALLKTGVHKLVEAPKEKGKGTTTIFTAMKAADAINLVHETYSIPELESMYADEESKKSRKNVLSSIEAQIEEMRTPDEPDSQE